MSEFFASYPPVVIPPPSGVISLNGLTGAVSLVAGTGISILAGSPGPTDITITNTIPATTPGGSSGNIQYNNGLGGFAGALDVNYLGGSLLFGPGGIAVPDSFILYQAITGLSIKNNHGSAILNLKDDGTSSWKDLSGFGVSLDGLGNTLVSKGNGKFSAPTASGCLISNTFDSVSFFMPGDGSFVIAAPTWNGLRINAVPGVTQLWDATSSGLTLNGGNATFAGTVLATNLSGTNTGNVTLTAVGASPSANGASLSGQALTLQPFDSTHPGVVTASGGGTANFARADGTWAAPAGTAGITALTGDVTGIGPGSTATTVAKIQGTTVSGTTGTTNVAFSASPTFTGTLNAATIAATGQIGTANNIAFTVKDSGGTARRSMVITGINDFNIGPMDVWAAGDTHVFSGAGMQFFTNNATSSNTALTLSSAGAASFLNTVSGTQFTSTIATGTAPLVVTSTTQVANLNAATAGTASTVTTNANMTGPITGTGNVTSITAQTGTGTTFVMSVAPTISSTLGLGAAALTGDMMSVSGTTVATGTTNRGVNVAYTGTSSATGSVLGYRSSLTTAASTTTTNVYNFDSAGLSVGASGTVTRFIAFADFGAVSHSATNNAVLADGNGFTGNYFLNQVGTDSSQFNAAIANSSYATSTATSGTINIAATKPGLIINSAGGTTLTIQLTASPLDGQECFVGSVGAFTTVTWQDNGGTAGNVIGGPTALGGINRGATFRYSSALTKWLNVG